MNPGPLWNLWALILDESTKFPSFIVRYFVLIFLFKFFDSTRSTEDILFICIGMKFVHVPTFPSTFAWESLLVVQVAIHAAMYKGVERKRKTGFWDALLTSSLGSEYGGRNRALPDRPHSRSSNHSEASLRRYHGAAWQVQKQRKEATSVQKGPSYCNDREPAAAFLDSYGEFLLATMRFGQRSVRYLMLEPMKTLCTDRKVCSRLHICIPKNTYSNPFRTHVSVLSFVCL